MRHFITFLVIAIIFGIIPGNAFASERLVLRYTDHDLEINLLKLQDRQLREVYGEIIAIAPETVELETDGRNHLYILAPYAKVYCNGLSSIWQALKPVCNRAYFESRILVNGRNEVILVNAFYYGEPCVINGWTCKNKTLNISVNIPNSGETATYVLANTARTPDGLKWLMEDQEIFVLYNIKHEIRAVFLPQ